MILLPLNSAPTHHPKDENDHGHHQQKMNQAAADMKSEEAQGPQNNQNDNY